MIRHVIRGEKKKKGPREKLLSPRKGSSRRREEREKRLFSIDEYFCSSYEKS